MTGYIGAIDQGTTSTRFIVFDRNAGIIAAAQQEHRQFYPRPGWVEHDADEIWTNTRAVIAAALSRADLHPSQLHAVGLTNQRETTLLWHRRTGKPLYHALVWQDTRVEARVAALARDGGKDRFRDQTGLPLASYFSALKIGWLLEHVEGARAQANAGETLFGTLDTWLLWNLTGGSDGGLHLTDVTNASRTQLMNLTSLDWDAELLEVFGVPRAMLPTICSSSEVYGEARTTGLAGRPIAGMLGDQQAALIGQACLGAGELKNTYGTGCFLLMNTGTRRVASRAGLITTVAYQLGTQPACYALEGSIANTGALVQWLRDNLRFIHSSSEVEALARSVEDNGDVYIVPAFSGLYAPHWRQDARGIIAGLTGYANRGHFARAALEACAYQTRDVVQAMAHDASMSINELKVDGGMVENDLLMQFQADILNLPVVRPVVAETTALGAAYAAGLATGYWASREDLVANCGVGRIWRPNMAAAKRAALCASWNKAVARSFAWVGP